MAEETDEVEQWEMGRSWFSQEKWDDNKPNIHKARQRYGHSLSLYIGTILLSMFLSNPLYIEVTVSQREACYTLMNPIVIHAKGP